MHDTLCFTCQMPACVHPQAGWRRALLMTRCVDTGCALPCCCCVVLHLLLQLSPAVNNTILSGYRVTPHSRTSARAPWWVACALALVFGCGTEVDGVVFVDAAELCKAVHLFE